jgi:benzodiazapine receptor
LLRLCPIPNDPLVWKSRKPQGADGQILQGEGMKLNSMARLALSLLLCLSVGIVGSVVTRPEIPAWYAGLAKPSWTPAPLVFPIAWTVLYVLMAVSFWRLWDMETRSVARTRAMTWFLVQLVLNALWSPVFFGWHGTRTALLIIIGLLIAIAATMVTASRVERLGRPVVRLHSCSTRCFLSPAIISDIPK